MKKLIIGLAIIAWSFCSHGVDPITSWNGIDVTPNAPGNVFDVEKALSDLIVNNQSEVESINACRTATMQSITCFTNSIMSNCEEYVYKSEYNLDSNDPEGSQLIASYYDNCNNSTGVNTVCVKSDVTRRANQLEFMLNVTDAIKSAQKGCVSILAQKWSTDPPDWADRALQQDQ